MQKHFTPVSLSEEHFSVSEPDHTDVSSHETAQTIDPESSPVHLAEATAQDTEDACRMGKISHCEPEDSRDILSVNIFFPERNTKYCDLLGVSRSYKESGRSSQKERHIPHLRGDSVKALLSMPSESLREYGSFMSHSHQ